MSRVLYRPRPATVEVDREDTPIRVAHKRVEAVREDWLVEDRWWTERPLRRRYMEIVTDDGASVVVFRDLASGRWFLQRGA